MHLKIKNKLKIGDDSQQDKYSELKIGGKRMFRTTYFTDPARCPNRE